MPSPTITGFAQQVIVGIADLAVSNNQNVVLATYSLGSCLGVTIYDPVMHVGGLVHVMLPDSGLDPAKAAVQPAMFMDTGVAALFRAAYGLRADKHRVQICVAGGAQVLDQSGFFSIGRRNHEALTRLMQQHGLVLQAEHVGGLVSRSMYLDVATGNVRLKVSGQPREVMLWNN
jgi:chemotaxis protein CheD